MPQADLCLFEAGLAELMEVTRRLDGIHAIDQMYSRLASGQRPAGPDTGDRYLHGLVHFLLGHVARYAEAFDLAVDRYERARRWFTDCSSMNCRLEDRHASYSIAMCQLKSGKLDAASGTLVAFEDLDDPVIMVFVRGLFAYVRAAIHLARDELAHAEASVAASLEFFKRFQSYSYGARAQLLLAWINLLAGHADQARSIFGELVGRTELPKTHIGRAECGYALCMDDSSAETARYFNGGLGKLLRGGDLQGAMSVLERATGSRIAKRPLGDLEVCWAELTRTAERLTTRRQSISGLTVEELIATLGSIRQTSPSTKVEAIGFA